MKQRKHVPLKPLVIAIGIALGLGTGGASANLRDVVQQTINTNPDILMNKNEYRARREEIRQAEAGYYPKVDANAGYGYEWSDNSTTRADGYNDGRELTRKELGVAVVQNVFDGHGTTNEVERHRARARATAHQIDGDAEKIGLNAAKVYIDVCRQQKLLDLANNNLKVHQRIHDQIKLRSESGVGRKADLDQIQARMALAENNIVAAKVNLQDAKTAFVKVVGQEAGSTCDIPNIRKDLPDSRDEAVRMALEGHPILKSAYADVDAATEQHEASSFNMYPRLDVEVGANANDDIDGTNGRNEDLSAMLRMRWNLYNGGKDTARRRETAHQINQAKDIRDRTHRQVEESTRLSWDAFKATGSQIGLLNKQVNANIKTRDAYVQQFNLNERTLLDVLNTENDLYQSRQELVNAEMDNYFAQYRIAADLGILAKIMNIAIYDEGNLPEYGKAVSIPDYTDAKYPNNQYMDVTKGHKMEVINGPNDEKQIRNDDGEAASDAANTAASKTSASTAARETVSPETAAVTSVMSERLGPQVSMAAQPRFLLQDIGIRDVKPAASAPVNQSMANLNGRPNSYNLPTLDQGIASNPPAATRSVQEETGGNNIAGFWNRMFK